jgi:cell division protein FtsQ
MKKIINITIWVAVLAGLSVLVGFIESEHKKITCKDLVVSIDYGEAEPLITAEEMNSIIYKAFDSLVGKKLTDINSVDIENHVNTIAFVESAEVYSTITGTMKIRVQQRNPVLRVINAYDQDYYIDREGKLMPVKTGRSTRVMVASGNIRQKYADTLDVSTPEQAKILHDLYTLSNFIRDDDFLRAQIEQIYVNSDNEFEMVPKVGRHLILFGNASDMEQKFDKLKAFYDQGMKKAGWNKYSRINLKYKDQVICEKK